MAPAEGMVYCRGCGKEIHHTAMSCPFCGCVQGAPFREAQEAGPGGMRFGQAVKTCLRKYVEFEGRAGRPEYWYFYLFNMLLFIVCAVLRLPEAQSLVSLALFLPNIAAAARRLHDSGRSGWNQLWSLTIIGIIPVVFWLARPGDPAENRFGPPPQG